MKHEVINIADLPAVLSASDVALILGISRAFAYNLFHSDGFPLITIGKRRLVRTDKFLNWLELQERKEA